jgi:hypothetical protein
MTQIAGLRCAARVLSAVRIPRSLWQSWSRRTQRGPRKRTSTTAVRSSGHANWLVAAHGPFAEQRLAGPMLAVRDCQTARTPRGESFGLVLLLTDRDAAKFEGIPLTVYRSGLPLCIQDCFSGVQQRSSVHAGKYQGDEIFESASAPRSGSCAVSPIVSAALFAIRAAKQ